jgi:DNA repair protein RadD
MIATRPYQEDGLTAIWQYFASGKTGNPVIAWPTGVGKSLLPAVFMERILKIWPNQRFLLATHVSTLIEQNAEVLKIHWPEAPLGIYSAGLKQRSIGHSIIYGGIQSMAKHPAAFGHRDIMFIDEAHLVSDDESSQYLTFIATMRLINPAMKIIGMSATPFRMGMGLLTEGKIFTDIIHDLTNMDGFNGLLADGYMKPLVPRRTHTELDVSNVAIAKGEFVGSQLQAAVDVDKITYAGLKEVVEAGHNRQSWLIFASGIQHAEHIAKQLGAFGIDCAAVHSKRDSDWNDGAIRAFKQNKLRAIANYSKLTTGFNHPDIDLIADFRPTLSIPLHIQKLGRGTRPTLHAKDCLVLDFSRNVPRLGPINDPIIPKKKNSKPGDVPVKICEECGTYNHTKVRFCTNCGHEFQFQIKLVAKAGSDEIIRTDLPIYETFEVDRVVYSRRQKDGRPAYIRASYWCGMLAYSENVFPEAKGYGKHLFHQWWMMRSPAPAPATADEALTYEAQLRKPKRIRVIVNRKYPEIVSAEY